MNRTPGWLLQGSPFLAHWLIDSMVAVTVVLGTGWLILALIRSPMRRQRLGEGLLLATLLLACLAAVPGIRPWSLGLITPMAHSVDPAPAAANRLHIGLVRHFGEQKVSVTPAPMQDKKTISYIGISIHIIYIYLTTVIATVQEWLPPVGIIELVYGLGAAFTLWRLLLGSWLLRRLVCQSSAPSPELTRRWNAIVRCVRTKRKSPRFSRYAALRLSQGIDSPISFGVFRAQVLLPAALVEQSTDLTIDAVLRHEYAHIDRRDPLSKLLTALAGVVYFYHPLVYWMNKRVGRDREFIADAIAARQCGGAYQYAEHLIALARACGTGRPAPLAVGLLTRRSDLSERIKRLIHPAEGIMVDCSPRRLVCGAAFLLAITVGLSLCTLRARGVAAKNGFPQIGSASALRRIGSSRLRQCRQRGVAFLLHHQRADGAWLGRYGPAVTALVTKALLQEGAGANETPVRKALAFIESCRHADGGFYGNTEPLYNTAIVMRTLADMPGDRFATQIAAARRFLEDSRPTSNSSATSWFRPNQHAKPLAPNWMFGPEESGTGHELRTAIRVAEHWDGNASTNLGRAAGVNAANLPNSLDSHERSARSRLHNYGNITYAQLKSMIYAGLSAQDSRVIRLRQWLRRHYTLAENPAEGSQRGLFYFYLTLAEVLHASHQRIFTDSRGRQHNWSRELLRRLAHKQQANGSWQNTSNGAWLEGNRIMATTYALLTLEEIQH